MDRKKGKKSRVWSLSSASCPTDVLLGSGGIILLLCSFLSDVPIQCTSFKQALNKFSHFPPRSFYTYTSFHFSPQAFSIGSVLW